METKWTTQTNIHTAATAVGVQYTSVYSVYSVYKWDGSRWTRVFQLFDVCNDKTIIKKKKTEKQGVPGIQQEHICIENFHICMDYLHVSLVRARKGETFEKVGQNVY